MATKTIKTINSAHMSGNKNATNTNGNKTVQLKLINEEMNLEEVIRHAEANMAKIVENTATFSRLGKEVKEQLRITLEMLKRKCMESGEKETNNHDLMELETNKKEEELNYYKEQLIQKEKKIEQLQARENGTEQQETQTRLTYSQVAAANRTTKPSISNKDRRVKSEQQIYVVRPQVTASIEATKDLLRNVTNKLREIRELVKIDKVKQNKGGSVIIMYRENEEKTAIEKIKNSLVNLQEVDKWNALKKRKLLIKGVPNHLDEDQIREDIKAEQNIDEKDYKIRLINNPKFHYNRIEITTSEEIVYKMLNNRLIIGFRTCYIEPLIKPIQCHNCCKFGHVATIEGKNNCRNEAKCLRCGQDHNIRECKIEREDREHIKCANCKLDHPANSSTCAIYIKIKNNLDKKW